MLMVSLLQLQQEHFLQRHLAWLIQNSFIAIFRFTGVDTGMGRGLTLHGNVRCDTIWQIFPFLHASAQSIGQSSGFILP